MQHESPDQPRALWVARAVRHATESPCVKSKRGVLIFRRGCDILDEAGTKAYVYGFNQPPPGFVCGGDAACRAACSKIAVHAEQQALLELSTLGHLRHGPLDALHVKVVDGALVAGGGPSCVYCSKLLLAAGIARMWLYEARAEGPRWVCYDTTEFHRLSLEACRLPAIQAQERS